MTWDFQAEAARRTRRLVIGLVVLVVILVAGILLLLLRPSGRSSAAGTGGAGTPGVTSAPASGDGAATATITPGSGFVAPARWVTLPGATTTRLGFPAGFPHTPEGAAAAEVAVVKAAAAAGWDYDAQDRVVRAYAVPAQMDQYRENAHALDVESRTALGLPETGPLPAGATISGAVIGVQWTPADADDVRVSVLERVTYTTSSSTSPATEIHSIAGQMEWVDDDWRDALQTNPTAPPSPVDIGSSDFNSAGWDAIQQGSAG